MVTLTPPPEKVPFNFQLTIQFSDAEIVSEMMEQIANDSKMVERNGHTYYKPPGKIMTNLSITKKGTKTIVSGTDAFLMGKNIMSQPLKKLWKSVDGNNAFRLAGDLKSASKFVDDFCDEFKEMDPMVGPQAQFLKLIDQITVAADATNKNVLNMSLKAGSEREAKKLNTNLNTFMTMAKMGLAGSMQAPSMKGDGVKSVRQLIKDVSKQLQFSKEGSIVSFKLKKPENLKEAIKQFQTVVNTERARSEKSNNFRQMALNVHNHVSAYRQFPFRKSIGRNKTSKISWRVHVLQFDDNGHLYNRADTSKSWDDPANKFLAEKMPKLYGKSKTKANACWIESKVRRFADVSDGTSLTIMLIENPAGVPWTQQKDISIDDAVKLVTNLKDGETLVAAFYDGSVRRLSNKINAKDLRALMTPQGGEMINLRKVFPRRR